MTKENDVTDPDVKVGDIVQRMNGEIGLITGSPHFHTVRVMIDGEEKILWKSDVKIVVSE